MVQAEVSAGTVHVGHLFPGDLLVKVLLIVTVDKLQVRLVVLPVLLEVHVQLNVVVRELTRLDGTGRIGT